MNFLTDVLVFVGVFSVLVFFHEMGHFWVARLFRVKIDVFSVGFGPTLWSRTDKKGTNWRISAVPLGGYVKFFGDANEASTPSPEMEGLSDADKAACFQFKPLYQRALIVAAGPIANFVLAIALFTGIFATIGQSYTSPIITQVLPESAAADAGLQPGDHISSLNGFDIDTFEDIVSYVRINAEQPVVIEFDRTGRALESTATIGFIEYSTPFGRVERVGQLGIGGTERKIIQRGPLEAVWYATIETGNNIVLVVESLGQFVTGQRAFKELGGPIKIGEIAGEVARLGIIPLITLTILLSINLGVINLLPVPMLDGGHLLFYAIEAIKKKPLGERTQEYGFRIGVAAILTLMVLVTWNDVTSLIDRLASP